MQQFPLGLRKSLASINYNDNYAIVQALANLHEIYSENIQNFERRKNFYNNTESVNVGKLYMPIRNGANNYQNRRGDRRNFQRYK